MNCRDKAARLTQLTKLSEQEHEMLKSDGALNHCLWAEKDYPRKDLVAKFREEVKEHYFWRQGSRCCYCSTELQWNARTFDAEHILDKFGFPEFMFHPENLAVACVICNTHKSTKPVLSDENSRPLTIPSDSDDYKILHPHLDEWHHHLCFDALGRIVPADGSTKGHETMVICAMEGINLLRLSQKFAPESRKNAYELMCKVVGYVSARKIEKTFSLMQELAKQSPDAIAVVATLKEMVEHKQKKRALEAAAGNKWVERSPDNVNA